MYPFSFYKNLVKWENKAYNLKENFEGRLQWKYTSKDIVRECNGSLVFGNENIECINFSTDTRKIENGDVYVGLKGEKFDGSKFFKDALERVQKFVFYKILK